ncbi:SLC13 family permease [Desulforamulus aeronauticus]|uniref:Possible tyrosine transporter P-protein n=1 Tax=Desulforamulus aeronauticus DSM 10349 TaxID=1121421 RepID=A0A1M6NXL8_9FIRM|nr:ArsB/NhaD family transporter [Desulforamulus aeronauticus]SHK00402.1 possible tyrosine transporter P-protein [Desulforamulus aeronauticus DSM 10349]
MDNFTLSLIIFVITYAFIVSEKLPRTVVALAGAVIVLFSGIVTQEKAIHYIDWNTIGLLVGMMIMVNITRRTGVFEYLAVKSAVASKGDPMKLLVLLAVITAVLSALLDNVTTVLLVVPVTFAICRQLQIPVMPFLVTEIMASNIGGTSTLIGDPPNIMISGPAGLSFMEFIYNLAPVAIVVFLVTIPILRFLYRKDLKADPKLMEAIASMNPNDEIKDPALLKKSFLALGLTILGFALHSVIHLPTATIAIAGAVLLLLMTREEPEHVLETVEWPTIFFFIGLFIVVGGLEESGVIHWVAESALHFTGGEIMSTGLLILWLSALASSFVDNIPFVATMIPLIQQMGQMGGITNLDPIWWSLALGACLGGNGTLVGAAANVIVAGMAEKRSTPISFLGFMKVAFPLMILSIIISTIYLVIFQLS